jgi:ubiquinone/menaquinone biosynthesis C-methylase UbiE
LKILEVGAGTGSATTAILDVLSPQGAPNIEPRRSKIAKYTFTDISSGFFENAKERFKPWRNIMTFQTLNAATEAGPPRL